MPAATNTGPTPPFAASFQAFAPKVGVRWDEKFLYVADSAWAPYGDREPAVINARVGAVADYLVGRGAKAIVVSGDVTEEEQVGAEGVLAMQLYK